MPDVTQLARAAWCRAFFALIALVLLLGAVAELFARFYLGLGDPPLWTADPEIEYLLKPSMSYQRFGNRIAYNAYSMRSDDFSAEKQRRSERRVLVKGDSVINGGALTDQADLATTLLQDELSTRMKAPVIVGNVSAGSWGPSNWLAYAQRFGFFDADVVAIVLSSHDYADAPTFPPLDENPDFPERSPVLALQEIVTRYLPEYLATFGPRAPPRAPLPKQRQIDATLGDLRELIVKARSSGATPLLVQHLERRELVDGPQPGHGAIQTLGEQMNVKLVQLGPAMAAALAAGDTPYRDNIHPSAAGQKVIAKTLTPILEQALIDRDITSVGTAPSEVDH